MKLLKELLMLAEARKEYSDFDSWKKAAVEAGYRVKLTTKTKSNCYYQAIAAGPAPKGGIMGFFNTAKGTDPDAKPTRAMQAGGSLNVKKSLSESSRMIDDVDEPGWYAVDGRGRVIEGPVEKKTDLTAEVRNSEGGETSIYQITSSDLTEAQDTSDRDAKLLKIAKKHFNISSFQKKNNDQEDFRDAAVWDIEYALIEAYKAGAESRQVNEAQADDDE